MRSIYIARLPIDLTRAKDVNPAAVRMDGGALYPAQFVTALIEHSRADVIYFPSTPLHDSADLRLTDVFLAHRDRIRFIPVSEFSTLPDEANLVLLSTGWRLEDLLVARSAFRGQPRPACALTHSLCSPSLLNTLLLLRLAPATEYDALVCSSCAGKQALEAMFTMISERCDAAGAKLPPCALALPVIPLGIDIGENHELARAGARNVCGILYFGRLATTSKSDLRPLLLAFSLLLREGLQATLTIAGDDTQSNLGPMLREFAAALGCKHHVAILSNPTSIEKEKLFAAADIFVSPSNSLQEQFGLSLLEAMRAGLPVVAANWSGHRDIVVHGETGFLVDTVFPAIAEQPEEAVGPMTSDHIAEATSVDIGQLTSYLRMLIADPALRTRFGIAATRRVRDLYSWKRVIGMHDDLWDSLRERAANAMVNPERKAIHFESWTPHKLFGGFATHSWRYSTRVISAPLQQSVVETICRSLAGERASNGLRESLLDRVRAEGECTVKRLVEESGESVHEVVHCLGLLAKHGLITVATECRPTTAD